MRISVLYTRTLWLHATILACMWDFQLLAEDFPKDSVGKPTAEAVEFFEAKIRPLLHARCVECHNDDQPESGLSLESQAGLLKGGKLGPAVTPGKPKESLLISAVNHDEFLKMPPKEKLATADLLLLSKWVAMGAPWPESSTSLASTKPVLKPNSDALPEKGATEFTEKQKSFWSYQPLRVPQVPLDIVSRNPDAISKIQSPIDVFVLEKLVEKGLQPGRLASPVDWIRRATYDLTGLPPEEEEIRRFMNDQSPDARLRLLDRLLASPRYGERWGRHWLDVARFADSNGLDENIAYANAFRYRDYVIDSMNADKSYDRFVQEQIAGDLLKEDPNNSTRDPFDRFVATGFLAIGAKMLAEDDPVKMQMDIIDEQLSTLCQAFMGITIGCARCHDHKFDPLPAADYYALAGIFKSTQTMENHRVVAKWFERPLATEQELETIRGIDREIDASKVSLNKLNEECRKRVAKEIQASIASALMATVQYEQFSELADRAIRHGANQSEPYKVDGGYALIEAEGFHRGTVIRDTENYGKGIGVIISNGRANAEYELAVEHEGNYAIELRYTADERRPIRVLLDGKEISASAAAEATGSWQPDGQTWFVATLANLTTGRHVLRLESRRTFPHIDKFSLVYQCGKEWPFGAEPVALSRTGLDLGISYPILSLWRNHFSDIRSKRTEENADIALGTLWLRFRDLKGDFETGVKSLYAELEADSPLRQKTPAMLRDALLAARPTTLPQVATLLQDATLKMSNASSEAEPFGKGSPLTGPSKDFDRYYSVAEREQASRIDTAISDAQNRRPKVAMAMGVAESKPENIKIHLRGSHLVLGKTVERSFPKILAGPEKAPISDSSSGRLELARWMTRADHPLTSRVMANRIWHWHFGRGIVVSVDNFGLLGQQPTHPELLDWLANEFVESQWSMKRLHRKIMLSNTYQIEAKADMDGPSGRNRAMEVDPENEFLWRFRRRRLTGEETRDSILAVGMGLDQTMYGTLMKVENHAYVNTTGTAGVLNYENSRRTIYLPVIRSGVFDVLQTLDFPDPAMLSGERQTSTVAPQALLMMNSDLVHEQTEAIARELVAAPIDDAQRISAVYRRILKRPPSLDELIAAANFLKHARNVSDGPNSLSTDIKLWQSLSRVLISSNEFSYIE